MGMDRVDSRGSNDRKQLGWLKLICSTETCGRAYPLTVSCHDKSAEDALGVPAEILSS